MAVKDWSTVAASNTTLGALSTQGSAQANTIDNLFREIMAQLAVFFTDANFVIDSTDAGATTGPDLTLYRNSATPAANDIIGRVLFQGEDSAGNTENYAQITTTINDPTSTSEDATISFAAKTAGTMTTIVTVGFGGFTSIGIDDNATGERLEINDSSIVVGSATAASTYQILRPVDTGSLALFGGSNTASGELILYGSTHATRAKDFSLVSNSVENFTYDFSADKFYLLSANGSVAAVYISGETRFAQDTTSTPGVGNNTIGGAISGAGAFYASAASAHQFNRTTDATVLFFSSGGTQQGSVSIAAATTSYNPFFGSHWSQLADKSQPEIWRGTICETIDELSDFAERVGDRLPKFKISDEEGSDAVYGVFHTWDSEVAGRAEIGALGAYFVRIAKGKKVKKGSLIESNGDGCGRVQRSRHFLASTVAKVTAAVVVEVYPDGSYRVPCTLHCG